MKTYATVRPVKKLIGNVFEAYEPPPPPPPDVFTVAENTFEAAPPPPAPQHSMVTLVPNNGLVHWPGVENI
jgi:hypothetical protein